MKHVLLFAALEVIAGAVWVDQAPRPPQAPALPPQAPSIDSPPAGYPPAPPGTRWVRNPAGPDGWGLLQTDPSPAKTAPAVAPRPFVQPAPGTTPTTNVIGVGQVSTGSPATIPMAPIRMSAPAAVMRGNTNCGPLG